MFGAFDKPSCVSLIADDAPKTYITIANGSSPNRVARSAKNRRASFNLPLFESHGARSDDPPIHVYLPLPDQRRAEEFHPVVEE